MCRHLPVLKMFWVEYSIANGGVTATPLLKEHLHRSSTCKLFGYCHRFIRIGTRHCGPALPVVSNIFGVLIRSDCCGDDIANETLSIVSSLTQLATENDSHRFIVMTNRPLHIAFRNDSFIEIKPCLRWLSFIITANAAVPGSGVCR